jgi:hypothetical protein
MKRRELLQLLLETAVLGSALSVSSCKKGEGIKELRIRDEQGSTGGLGEPQLLLIVVANGGASMIDCFLPIESTSSNTDIYTYSNSLIENVTGSNFKCVKSLDTSSSLGLPDPNFEMKTFLLNHSSDMALISQDTSSVNHHVAAQRVLNGDGFYRGTKITELNSNAHGANFSLANINLAGGGFGVAGGNEGLIDYAKALRVATAPSVAFSTHRFKGIDYGISESNVKLARLIRNKLEQKAQGILLWKDHENLERWLRYRENVKGFEDSNIIDQLLFLERVGADNSNIPVLQTPFLNKLKAAFPNLLTDPYESQAAIAFLLFRNGLSNSVTIDMNLGLGFDQSHQFHTEAQNYMWRRTLKTLDALLTLFKTEYYMGDPKKGTIWNRLVTYVPTEFGRDKNKKQGSGHNLNNAHLLLSPKIKGNRLYGSLNETTGHISGFDLRTGKPDPSKKISEKHMYSIIASALEIPFPGRHNSKGVLK